MEMIWGVSKMYISEYSKIEYIGSNGKSNGES